jgi:hypothetical protein
VSTRGDRSAHAGSEESLYGLVKRRDERTLDAARVRRATKWLQDSCPS